MRCYYCDLITGSAPSYAGRDAAFDLGSEAPRCAWHWRFVCDHCGEPGHFMERFSCPSSGRLLCPEAGPVEQVAGNFWAWEYRFELACPDCGGRHPSLDYAEVEGSHPWLADPRAAGEHRWLSDEPYLVRYPVKRLDVVPPERVTDADVDASWSGNADLLDAGYDERGDTNRKYSSDPVLLDFLGDVRGQRVLDAGSGQGYLARLLARRGASVVAVENARRFHELALAYQRREPLPIEHRHASISSMPFLEDASVDAAVANYVLIDVPDYEGAVREIARVLKPGGRFVYTVMHGTLGPRWYVPAPDSPRREDRAGFLDDGYFVRTAGYVQWGSFKPFLSFHRPMRDYVAACKAAGLELRDVDEPSITDEARRIWPAWKVREELRNPISYVLKFVKPSVQAASAGL